MGQENDEGNLPDWILSELSHLQRVTVTGLAAELRAGGILTAALAFGLGAIHALTPGHGKTALAAYFLGQEARLATGIRLALAAAFFHVATGFMAFVIVRLIMGQLPAITARGSPLFQAAGYALILLAGAMMIFQSLRSARTGPRAHLLAAGIGLLPCPLTITVLGFAWAQASGPMVGLVLISLATGIAFTIGMVALAAIVGRRFLSSRIEAFERGARIVQGVAGAMIVIAAGYAIVRGA